ncbi:MAG: polysaccharide deacetylase family protein [Desulfovibrio sp.]|nr:polysaccharide deacetylase family protein [Desulfovibrio sp.]
MKVLVSLLLLVFASALRCSAYTVDDFLREMDEPGLCALTFDDGPSVYTGRLLDMMAAEHVKATFFVLGENAARLPDMIRRELAEGHEVANHSWSHPNLRRVSTERIRREMETTVAVLAPLGASPRFFRPPYGSYSACVEETANSLGMEIALWSHDSRDWKRLPKSYAALVPCQSVEDRHGVFLFHDIHERTVNDFPRIVSELRNSGCRRFVTLSEYMAHVGPRAKPAPKMPELRASHRRAYCRPSHGSALFLSSVRMVD